jgi:hypothetical protein
MVRSLLTEFALFVAPFAAYALFLWATRAGVLHPDSWPLPIVAGLSLTAAVLMIGSFVVLAQLSGVPGGSSYVPAHMEKGRLVPGRTK